MRISNVYLISIQRIELIAHFDFVYKDIKNMSWVNYSDVSKSDHLCCEELFILNDNDNCKRLDTRKEANISFHPALCIDLINICNILSLTEIYIAFYGTPVTSYLFSFGYLVVNPVHFLLTDHIKRGN